MAKSETVLIRCDRCQKETHRGIKESALQGEGIKLNLSWRGKIECSMEDLCPRCFTIVAKHVDVIKRVTKEETGG